MPEKSGWIKIHRKIANNSLFKDDPLSQWVFIKLIEMAAWKDTTTSVNRKPVPVLRGQVIVSLRRLAKLTGLSVKQVRTRLGTLKRHKIIEMGTQRGTAPAHITICK